MPKAPLSHLTFAVFSVFSSHALMIGSKVVSAAEIPNAETYSLLEQFRGHGATPALDLASPAFGLNLLRVETFLDTPAK